MYEQPFNPYASNLAAVKKYFRQPRVLVLAIIYVLAAVAEIARSLAMSGSIPGLLNDIANFLDKIGVSDSISPADMDFVNSSASQLSVLSSMPSLIISAAVTLIIAAAFFIIYFKSRNESAESTPNPGVTILYVISVISLVFAIIGAIGMIALAAILFSFSGAVSGSVGETKTIDIGNGYQMTVNGPSLSLAMIIIAVLLLIVVALLLFTTINKMRYYSSVRTSINSVTLQSGGAKPYGVMCVISAVFSAFGVLGSLSAVIILGSAGFSSLTGPLLITVLVNLLSFLAPVVDAKIALGYKKYIDQLMYGYNEPDYSGSEPVVNPLPEYNRQDNATDAQQNPYSAPQPKTYNDGFSQNAQPADRPAAPAVCPNCGAPTEGGPFCGNCGTKL